MSRVLVTGVNGLIGRQVYNSLSQAGYDVVGLDKSRTPSERLKDCPHIPEDRFVEVDVADAAAVARALSGGGFSVVVHLAADPRADAPFESTLSSNVIGCKTVLAACVDAGVKRIVLASSIMVSWGYWLYEEPYAAIREGRFEAVDAANIPMVRHDSPPRPTTDYAASKLWGEALARAISDNNNGMSCLCIRFGAVYIEDDPRDRSWGSLWLSKRDAAEIVRRCVEAPKELKYDVFYAVSNSDYRWVDVSHAREVLGWEPKDSTEERLKMLTSGLIYDE